jgi:hypothetical protein
MNIKYIMTIDKVELPAIGTYKANHGFQAVITRAEDRAEVRGSLLSMLRDAQHDGQRLLDRADAFFEEIAA